MHHRSLLKTKQHVVHITILQEENNEFMIRNVSLPHQRTERKLLFAPGHIRLN